MRLSGAIFFDTFSRDIKGENIRHRLSTVCTRSKQQTPEFLRRGGTSSCTPLPPTSPDLKTCLDFQPPRLPQWQQWRRRPDGRQDPLCGSGPVCGSGPFCGSGAICVGQILLVGSGPVCGVRSCLWGSGPICGVMSGL